MELVFVSQVLCIFLGARTWLRDDKLTTLSSHWSCLVYFLLVQGSCCPCVSCSRTQKSKRCVVIACRVHVFSGIVTDLVFKLCQAYLSTLSALLSKNSVVRLSTGKNQELYCWSILWPLSGAYLYSACSGSNVSPNVHEDDHRWR